MIITQDTFVFEIKEKNYRYYNLFRVGGNWGIVDGETCSICIRNQKNLGIKKSDILFGITDSLVFRLLGISDKPFSQMHTPYNPVQYPNRTTWDRIRVIYGSTSRDLQAIYYPWFLEGIKLSSILLQMYFACGEYIMYDKPLMAICEKRLITADDYNWKPLV